LKTAFRISESIDAVWHRAFMTEPDSLYTFAARILHQPDAPEADIRRAISALYYGMFHMLAAAGAVHFAPGGKALQTQVARAFKHTTMQKVCKRYAQLPKPPFPPGANGLVPTPPDQRLAAIASAFLQLQEARHVADYDLSAHLTIKSGRDLMQSAAQAARDFTAVRALPETTVFLAALLLDDRLTHLG
jgi:hypothetical protein